MPGKHVRFDSFGTPSPTFSSASLPSSPGPVTPPSLGIGSPYHTTPLPTVPHPALAISQPLWRWDMSYPTETIVARTNLPSDIWTQAATQPAVGSMDIICSRLPWRITIYPRVQGSYVTVADVFDGLYRALSISVTAAEFDLLPSSRAKHAVNDAFLRRWKRQPSHALQIAEQKLGMKRMDFLGDRSGFGGLSYAKEGWVLNLS